MCDGERRSCLLQKRTSCCGQRFSRCMQCVRISMKCARIYGTKEETWDDVGLESKREVTESKERSQ
jgi:hypothetical protein